MIGLGDYILMAPPVYPPVVDAWHAIPADQVASFAPFGFCLADCWDPAPLAAGASGAYGLGDVALTSPGGYFGAGGDFSSWGLAEWATVALGLYVVASLLGDTRRHVRKARKAVGAYRSTK